MIRVSCNPVEHGWPKLALYATSVGDAYRMSQVSMEGSKIPIVAPKKILKEATGRSKGAELE